MEFHVIIPARYQSVRLPGKALLDIAGKPMIQHVYEKAQQSGAASITVATDDQRIVEAVKAFSGDVCITNEKHRSGTERIAEAVKILDLRDDAIVVNVQGDEPLIPPRIIKQVADNLHNSQQASMSTLCTPILKTDDIFNTNIVKVICDKNDYAIYFSRAPIPWNRDTFKQNNVSDVPDVAEYYFRHIGIYAYNVNFIDRYLTWTNSPIEEIECLEQLRTIWHGEKIHVATAKEIPPQDVNSEEDVIAIKKYFSD